MAEKGAQRWRAEPLTIRGRKSTLVELLGSELCGRRLPFGFAGHFRLLSDLDIVQIWTKHPGRCRHLCGGGVRHGSAGVRLVPAITFTLTNQKQSLRCAPVSRDPGRSAGLRLARAGLFDSVKSQLRTEGSDDIGLPVVGPVALPTLASTSCMRAASSMSEKVIYQRNVTYGAALRTRRTSSPL